MTRNGLAVFHGVAMNDNDITHDELNDAICDYIDRAMPRPVGGFESSGDEYAHIAAHEAEYIRIVHLPRAEILGLIGR